MNKLLQVSCLVLIPFLALAEPPKPSVIVRDTAKVHKEHKNLDGKYIGKKGLTNFGVTGNYRGMVYYRNMDELFDGTYSEEKMLLSTNDGGRQSQLELDVVARPTSTTSFRTDFYLYSPMRGAGLPRRDAPPIPPKKVSGTLNTSAQGHDTTRNISAR